MANFTLTFIESAGFRHSLDPEALYRISFTLGGKMLPVPPRRGAFMAERAGIKVAMEVHDDFFHVGFAADGETITEVGISVKKRREMK